MNSTQDQPLRIAIYGDGLAADIANAALISGLGTTAQIVRVSNNEMPADDILFGGATSPSTYDFFRTIGLTEPRLFLGCPTTFSYGTKFEDWPGTRKTSWLQGFEPPIQPLFGVPFHQFIANAASGLAPFLLSSQAALAGKFAHPPNEEGHPLARSEYGYHFSAAELSALLSRSPALTSTQRVQGKVTKHEVTDGVLQSIELDNGTVVEADLFIDCSGVERALISALDSHFTTDLSLKVSSSQEALKALPPYRTIRPETFGWELEVPLQNRLQRISVSLAGDRHDAGSLDAFDIGRLDEAWIGNCIALGNAAAALEPLSPAPMMLLERCIERLLELIPNTKHMAIERREFNRRFSDDADNIALFHRSFFMGEGFPDGAYWQAKEALPVPDRLARKLRQFESRGLLVQYDYEPFNAEDWAIQHFGMGRRAQRQDAQVNGMPKDAIENALGSMATTVERTATSMPPHHIYLGKFKDYLARKHLD